MRRIRLGAIAVLAVLVVIVAVQNTAAVETRILLATVTMPRALLLFITLTVGFVVGVAASDSVLGRIRQARAGGPTENGQR